MHIAHVSCRQGVELIAWAKEKGVPVTAETCPHFLTLTEEAVRGYDANAKVNPPLRTAEDQAALLDALNAGVVDILATDHAPHAAHEKEVEFDKAPFGISGLDTALSVTWGLVAAGRLKEEAFLRAWTTSPAAAFGVPVNRFEPGDPADFFLFDPDAVWTVGPETMRSKSANTPLLGQPLHGRVVHHYVAGAKLF